MSIAEKLTKVAENVPKVYEAGQEAGKKTAYDEFWDAFQQNGKRRDYRGAFGSGWTNDLFKPKYPIKPKDAYSYNLSATRMFSYVGPSNNKYLDLGDYPIDLRDVNPAKEVFQNSYLKNLYLDISNTTANNLFVGNDMDRNIRPYRNVTIKCNANTKFTAPFYYSNFDKLMFTNDSEIAQNGIVLDYATSLSKESIANIINTLSTTTSGLSITFNKKSVNTAFGINVDDVTTYPEGTEYYNLRHSKDNWTISYV